MTMPPPSGLSALYPEAAFLSRIGAGACGEVWLARFPDGTFRAVKYVAAVPGRGDAAARERRAIHLLHSLADPAAPSAPLHPALLPIRDLRETASSFAYAMPPADSLRPNWRTAPSEYRPRTLQSDLLARRALPLPECLALAEALASALEFLQRHCLVHRDIKPANVLYLRGAPVLADFGLLVDTREADSVVGTPGYVPDEQHGRFPADIYSLGVLLTEATTGNPPDAAGFAPVDEADTAHPLFPRWFALLHRATDPNPARRPQTATAFLKELRALTAPPSPPKWRNRLLWILLAVVLCVLWGVIFHALEKRRSVPSPVPAEERSSPPPPETPPIPSPPESPLPPEASPAPPRPVPLPAADHPRLYLSRQQTDAGVYLQPYSDRIRVGLPRPGGDPEDYALLLLYPEDTPRRPWMETTPAVPCCIVPLVQADSANTPPTHASDPAFPSDTPYAARTTRSAIAMLPLSDPYPEVVFFLPDAPAVWRNWLETHPGADFDDIETIWYRVCVFAAIRRDLPSSGGFASF